MSSEQCVLSTMPLRFHDAYLNTSIPLGFENWIADEAGEELMLNAIYAAMEYLHKRLANERNKSIAFTAMYSSLYDSYQDYLDEKGEH